MAPRITIIGSGPGGYQAAIRAAQLGAQVTVIERDTIGGTCLNYGCIPTKTLRASANMLHNIQRASTFGIIIDGTVRPDMQLMIERKDEVVATLTGGIARLFNSYAIRYLAGSARVIDPRTVTVTSTTGVRTEVEADRIICAHGSSPRDMAAFPFDNEFILSTNDALMMKDIPDSMLILGGGVIGSEFAGIFSNLGVKVTIVEALDRLLPIPFIDRDLSKTILREMKKQKIRVILNKTLDQVEVKHGKVRATLGASPFVEPQDERNGTAEILEADKLLVTVGRTSNTVSSGLDEIGMNMEGNGWISVNERMETSLPGMFAIGDVLGPEKMMLAHVASVEGMVAVENALGGKSSMDYRVVPSTIFTFPEAASVGLSEEQAIEQGYAATSSSFLFRILGKAQAMGEIAGEIKIISDNGKAILGVHIVGPHASDLIAEGALAMKMNATVEDLATTIHAHPTLSEAFLEVSHSTLGSCIHCPPK